MRHVLLGRGGRRLQVLIEIHLPQFHQDAGGATPVVKNPRIDDPHDMLTLENEKDKHSKSEYTSRPDIREISPFFQNIMSFGVYQCCRSDRQTRTDLVEKRATAHCQTVTHSHSTLDFPRTDHRLVDVMRTGATKSYYNPNQPTGINSNLSNVSRTKSIPSSEPASV